MGEDPSASRIEHRYYAAYISISVSIAHPRLWISAVARVVEVSTSACLSPSFKSIQANSFCKYSAQMTPNETKKSVVLGQSSVGSVNETENASVGNEAVREGSSV